MNKEVKSIRVFLSEFFDNFFLQLSDEPDAQ